jgi:hypothetical protein
MTNNIRTYEDLIKRQRQLELLLQLQKEQVRNDVREFMDAGKSAIVGTSENFLLNKGVSKVIDLVVKKGVLGRAGWLYRLIVPFVLKRYSTKYIAEHKKDIKEKFFSFFRGKSNGIKHEPKPNL